MFELMIMGGLYALGAIAMGLLCYGVGALLTWPLRLRNELANEKQWHANTKEYLKKEQESRECKPN